MIHYFSFCCFSITYCLYLYSSSRPTRSLTSKAVTLYQFNKPLLVRIRKLSKWRKKEQKSPKKSLRSSNLYYFPLSLAWWRHFQFPWQKASDCADHVFLWHEAMYPTRIIYIFGQNRRDRLLLVYRVHKVQIPLYLGFTQENWYYLWPFSARTKKYIMPCLLCNC